MKEEAMRKHETNKKSLHTFSQLIFHDVVRFVCWIESIYKYVMTLIVSFGKWKISGNWLDWMEKGMAQRAQHKSN